ncbi:MAG: T9SS C-terminal target domain-containing protein [Marinilabiliales bacterium]|nr:MAG: T9SS C-terminal target domain-containing protein [Marinilabiliales bacterium]
MKVTVIFVISALVFSFANANDSTPAFEMNQRLGRGINIGNTFEAPSETAWSNPWNHDYAGIISELGFSHIRVPVRWEPRSMDEPPYTIDVQFFERLKSVIDTALYHNLHVIINMHHHDALLNDPDGQKERFLSQWEQIAEYFKDYPDSLLFEIFNEPHGNFTPQKWNEFFPEALSKIRLTNPDRMVLIGTADWGGLGGLGHLVLPDDPNLILTVHYYSPFQFTHQGASWVGGDADAWLGTRWNDTEAEREAIESDFRAALQFSEEHNIPVHVGEFGAYSRADMDSRVRWTTFNSRYFEQLGFSWAYWEFSAGFGIYDRNSGQLRQELVDALLHNTIGDPTETLRDTIYASDFTTNNDGWSLNTGGGASATMVNETGELDISISIVGSDAWNVQLVKSGILLEKGRNYRVAFKASADGNKSISTYAGRASSPWGAYSGFHGKTVGTDIQEHSFTFQMSDPTDPATRLVFDLGADTKGFTLYDYVLERLTIVIPYDVNITAENGNVLVDPETDLFMGGETYTLTAVPDEGYVFTGWSGDITGTENPVDLFIFSDMDITANFAALYALSVTAENGSVTVDPEKEEYQDGETVTLTAVPDEGFFFEGWSGDAIGDDNPLQITMDANKDIVAVFAEIPVTYILTVTSENGMVTIDPDQDEYLEGDTVILTAVADDGFIFTGWSGDADGEENPLEIIMDSDKNITANFDVDTGIDGVTATGSEMLFFPNPLADGSLFIRTGELSDIAIYNVTGSLHLRYDSVKELEIDRSEFDSGLYIIKISSSNKVRSGILMVK